MEGFYLMKEQDFNYVKEWMHEKLAERKMSTNMFVIKTGYLLTNATVFRWYNDTFRPSEKSMQIVCDTLSLLPILEEGKPPRYEEVPLGEGMAQFSARKKGPASKRSSLRRK
jgi:hypothetical protein